MVTFIDNCGPVCNIHQISTHEEMLIFLVLLSLLLHELCGCLLRLLLRRSPLHNVKPHDLTQFCKFHVCVTTNDPAASSTSAVLVDIPPSANTTLRTGTSSSEVHPRSGNSAFMLLDGARDASWSWDHSCHVRNFLSCCPLFLCSMLMSTPMFLHVQENVVACSRKRATEKHNIAPPFLCLFSSAFHQHELQTNLIVIVFRVSIIVILCSLRFSRC